MSSWKDIFEAATDGRLRVKNWRAFIAYLLLAIAGVAATWIGLEGMRSQIVTIETEDDQSLEFEHGLSFEGTE